MRATTVCTWSVPVTMLVTCDRAQRYTWQFYHRCLVSYACKQLLTLKCITANSSTDSALRSMPLSTFLWSNKSPALPTIDHRCDVTLQYSACDSDTVMSHLSSIVGSAGDLFDHRIQMCSSPFRCMLLLLKDLNSSWSHLDTLTTIYLSM
jgi:hypothetical protein